MKAMKQPKRQISPKNADRHAVTNAALSVSAIYKPNGGTAAVRILLCTYSTSYFYTRPEEGLAALYDKWLPHWDQHHRDVVHGCGPDPG